MGREFEYDLNKSIFNKVKHGIDFESAKLVWSDPFAMIAPTRQVEGESRFIIIGLINGKVWSVIFTFRGEKFRLISARRSRKNEVVFYEKNKSGNV